MAEKIIKPYKNKGECLALETGDMTGVLDIVITSLKKHRGTQAIYPNDREGLEEFINATLEYFAEVKRINDDPNLEKKLIPDIESWTLFIGITRQTLMMYSRRSQVWSQTIEEFKNGIMTCKKQLAMSFKMPPLVFVFDSINNHGYVNASEFHLTPEPVKDTLPAFEEVQAKLPPPDTDPARIEDKTEGSRLEDYL